MAGDHNAPFAKVARLAGCELPAAALASNGSRIALPGSILPRIAVPVLGMGVEIFSSNGVDMSMCQSPLVGHRVPTRTTWLLCVMVMASLSSSAVQPLAHNCGIKSNDLVVSARTM